MPKKVKYPAQELTEEDKKLIGQISLKFAVKISALISKYPNPKDYAEKVILKDVHSKNYIAGVHMLAIAKNATSNHLFKPHEINQKLANIIRNYDVQQDFKSSVLLHPRSLSRVLKDHKELGTFLLLIQFCGCILA
jgi:phenylpyruvate tautomerase PptA (4-oxalocrotonate tautomerase family)